jgi:bifunctional DNase/RNase
MPLVECQLSRVVMSETHDHHVLWLKEKVGERQMAISIGFPEVWAVHRVINQEPPPRPLTHELFASVLRELDVRVERVVVHALRDKTYYGRLILRQDGKTYDIDSRPSDALVLAVQQGAPIFVEEEVLERASH